MATAGEVLQVARGELGVKEQPAGSNRVKYNKWFYGREVSGDAYPWCCVFVCWVFAQAGGRSLLPMTGGCTTMMNWFKGRGQLVPPAQMEPGDLVFYQFDKDAYADHIGIVETVGAKGSFTAIEGNTSRTSDDNGGAVMRRSRRVGAVMAVARPGYEEETDMTRDEVTALVRDEIGAMTAPQVYNTVAECPAWAREAVAWAVDGGYIRGDEHGDLGLTATKLWALQVTYNIMTRGAE